MLKDKIKPKTGTQGNPDSSTRGEPASNIPAPAISSGAPCPAFENTAVFCVSSDTKNKEKTKERKFAGAISVRFDTKKFKIELCPAHLQGADASTAVGLFRVRINRRWLDTPEGQTMFLGQGQIASLVASLAASGELPQLPTLPNIPQGSRVSVKFWHHDTPYTNRTLTSTPPIRAYDGNIYIGVHTYEAGFIWAGLEDITVISLNHKKTLREQQIA